MACHILKSSFSGSRLRPAPAGLRRGKQGSAQPPAKRTAGQVEKETLKKRITNNEQGMMNVEVRYSIDLY